MRCSVVFGVTSRLLVIIISSSSLVINTAAYYQRCVITCDTLALLHRRLRLQHLSVAALTQAVKPDIGSESRFLPTQPAFDAPVRGVPVGVLPFGAEKLEWCGYRKVKKNWRYLYSFWHNARTWQTHTQTQTAWRHRPRLLAINVWWWWWWCIASRGKNKKKQIGYRCQKRNVSIGVS